MKNNITHTVMAAWISLATLPVLADQTNLVQRLEVNLVGIEQGGSTTVNYVTRTTVNNVNLATGDIIACLGTATGNNFSRQAKLVVITPLPSGAPTVAVRDAGNAVDVTAFFSQLSLSGMVGSSTVNSKNGKSNGINYGIQQFTLKDAAGYPQLTLHYAVSGVAVENFTIPAIPGPFQELNAAVSGTGDSGGNLLILLGTLRIYGQQVEVVPGGGGPPS